MAGNTAHTNIGTERQGTAVLTRDTIERTAIEKLPNGRGIEARCEQPRLVNLCTPSGCINRKERKSFLNKEVIYLRRHLPHNYVM
jgi:hypothetical protein